MSHEMISEEELDRRIIAALRAEVEGLRGLLQRWSAYYRGEEVAPDSLLDETDAATGGSDV